MYLVDTDVVVPYLNGRADAVALLNLLLSEGIAISVITFGEIYEGVYFGSDPAHHMAGFRRFLQGVRVLEVNRRIARQFGQIRGLLRRQGQLLPAPDLRPSRERTGLRSHPRHAQSPALSARSGSPALSAAIDTSVSCLQLRHNRFMSSAVHCLMVLSG